MVKAVANVLSSNTFGDWLDRTNVIADTLSNEILTVNDGAFTYETRASVQANSVPATVGYIYTIGYANTSDGGGALYKSVGAEPSHAFKVQSGDGGWWEGVPRGGKVYAEQFGAINGGTVDNQAELANALAYVNLKGITLVAKGLYGLSSTLVFPGGQYGFEGPDQIHLDILENGFRWIGANNDIVVEINRIHLSKFGNMIVSNAETGASGMTGVEIRAANSSVAGDSIGGNIFERFYITGFNKGLQIGNFTRDGWNTNFDDNVVEDFQTYDVANPLILDGGNMDNNMFVRFHNGGPATNVSSFAGTRNNIIHAKSNGIGFRVVDGFARIDGMTANNAAIQIDKGSFSTDHFSFETSGSENCRAIDLNSTAVGRHQCVLKQIVTTGFNDANNRIMRLNYPSGTVLMGCSVSGDIEILKPTYAVGTTFEGSYTFIGAEARYLQQHNTNKRTNPNSTITSADHIRAPATLGTSQNDYKVDWAYILRQPTTASIDITGFDSLHMARTGQHFIFMNANGAGGNTITLKNQDANSTNINRIQSLTNADIVIGGLEAAILTYDYLAFRWLAWKVV